MKEYERARGIYKFGLEKLAKPKSLNLCKLIEKILFLDNDYTLFEKQHGEKESIENVIVGKRRIKYEEVMMILYSFYLFPFSFILIPSLPRNLNWIPTITIFGSTMLEWKKTQET